MVPIPLTTVIVILGPAVTVKVSTQVYHFQYVLLVASNIHDSRPVACFGLPSHYRVHATRSGNKTRSYHYVQNAILCWRKPRRPLVAADNNCRPRDDPLLTLPGMASYPHRYADAQLPFLEQKPHNFEVTAV
ncbi:hypothetical protein B0F90DRAFT_629281 [Multifurca ochricompacta]|uniref:Secreted protein n=1 Tax=Multifurca ochricompacta TaxID=376703 RepID=A0AAD4QIX6_9AGAM|nr:hypothetical protein B0F90DRAFT_629281 [Multifurca ochricompacta]